MKLVCVAPDGSLELWWQDMTNLPLIAVHHSWVRQLCEKCLQENMERCPLYWGREVLGEL